MTTHSIVYAGLRRMSGGKTGHWYVYTGPGFPDFGGFVKPLIVGHRIGTLIELTEPSEGKYRTGGEDGPKALGAAEVEPEMLARWQLVTETIKVEDAAKSANRRLSQRAGTPLDDAVETIRLAMDGMTWHQRQAAIDIIIRRIAR